MDFGEIVSNGLKYPSTGWSKVLILGVILIIPIVNFIGWGYLLRIMRATFTGIDELPDFDEVGELFIDGIKIFVIGLIAAIPFIVIYLIILFATFGAAYSTTISYGILALIFILYVILFLLVYPFLLMYSVRSITLMASRE
ncbi:MAG: DUF4013 domain-containing protein [Methanobacterium sp.]|nr:DUF4013 domain-containing protein [Methanobacterium sp.]